MEYKTIEELYASLGIAGAVVVVFLGIFVYTIVQNDKRRSREMKEIIEKLGNLQINDTNFQNAMTNLADAVKELSTTNRIVADTVSKLDYYNKDFNRKLDKHDDKCDKILDALRK
ncbi:hypothetical protein ABID14_000195 [Peptoniphilus olsenii]|uniref:Uncharacterized protein n=1 Tax=Peptoniphilus olsenii TaxID=411570 RepID=A0ABV2J730_9FIRM